MALRNVISTNAAIDVSEEYSDAVADLVNSDKHPERETYRHGLNGEPKDYRVALVTYQRPGTGETVWAVDYSDSASREVEESDDRDEAEERYEEMVRESAALLGEDRDGIPEVFDQTDVPGVPGFDGIFYEVETSLDGEIWQTIHSDEETLENPSGRVAGEQGDPAWSDPHAEAAQQILADHLVETGIDRQLVADMADVPLVAAEADVEVVQTSAGMRLFSGGRPVLARRVRVYNGTAEDCDSDPAAEATAYSIEPATAAR